MAMTQKVILEQEESSRVQLFTPLQTKYSDRSLAKDLDLLLQKGYTRILLNEELLWIEEFLADEKEMDLETTAADIKAKFLVLVDRFSVRKDDEDI